MVRCAVFLILLTLLTSCSISHDKKIKELESKLGFVQFYPSKGWKSSWGNVISASDKLLKYVPNHPEAHYEKGRALHQLGKYKEAIDSFDKTIKYKHLIKGFYSLSPKEYSDIILNQSYYEKAECLRALGKLEEALENFDLAIKHGLDHRHINHERTEVLMELGRELD